MITEMFTMWLYAGTQLYGEISTACSYKFVLDFSLLELHQVYLSLYILGVGGTVLC